MGFPSLLILLPRVYTSKSCRSHTNAQPLKPWCPPIELPFVVSHGSAAFLHVCGRAQLPPNRTSTSTHRARLLRWDRLLNFCPRLEGNSFIVHRLTAVNTPSGTR